MIVAKLSAPHFTIYRIPQDQLKTVNGGYMANEDRSIEALFPPGVMDGGEHRTIEDLEALQAWADKTGALLPTQLNINLDRHKKPQAKEDDDDVLLPCGFGR
jgi:hypothetical protein